MGDSFLDNILGLAPPSMDGLDRICHSGNSNLSDRENPLSKALGSTFPCNLNAAEVTSLALGGGLLMMIISIILMVVVSLVLNGFSWMKIIGNSCT